MKFKLNNLSEKDKKYIEKMIGENCYDDKVIEDMIKFCMKPKKVQEKELKRIRRENFDIHGAD